jgi:hypothetical protein
VAAPPPRPELPADDDAIEVTFDSLTAEEVDAIERFATPRAAASAVSAGTADVEADELGVRAVRALEHLAVEMRRADGDLDPDRTGLPEHLALAVGRSLSGRLAPAERAVLDRVRAGDRVVAARAAEIERLWPRVRAWMGAPAAVAADGAAVDGEVPRPLRWMRWLPIVLVAAIGASLLARFEPVFALFEETARFGAVPYVDSTTRTGIGSRNRGETAIVARSFLVGVDCPGDTNLVLAAFPARGPAWRAFPRSASDALLPAGFHVLPDGASETAFELPMDCGPTTIVTACRDEPLSDGDLLEIDALLEQGSEGTLRTALDARGFRCDVLTVVEPDR